MLKKIHLIGQIENIFRIIMELLGYKIWRPKKIIDVNNIKYKPDFEDDNFYYEIKTRNWTTTGTIGEKIFSVPYKYSSIPLQTGKKIKIILIAFQEYECSVNNSLSIFYEKLSTEKIEQLKLFQKQGFEYIPFTYYINLIK